MTITATYDYDVNVLIGAPLESYTTGKLELELDPAPMEGPSTATATGTLTIGEFSDPIPVTGTASYHGSSLDIKGESAQAMVELDAFFASQGIGDENNYIAGILQLFDKNGDEWIYYVLNGAQAKP